MRVFSQILGATFGALVAVSAVTAAHASTVEKVTLSDKDGKMTVKISAAKISAGKVTFDVTNLKSSASEHEMIVVALTPDQIAHPDSLPYIEKDGRVDEEKIKDLGEVSELQPGHSGSLTLTMKAGTYMLLCNVPGHYKMGMYSILTVK